MTVELDLLSLLSLVAAMGLLYTSAMGLWMEESLLVSRLAAALALVAAWWATIVGLAFTRLAEWYPPLPWSSQLLSGFVAPVLFLLTLAYLGLVDRWSRWWLLVLLPGTAGIVRFLLVWLFVPTEVLIESWRRFLAGGAMTGLPVDAYVPWVPRLTWMNTIQVYGFALASTVLLVHHGLRSTRRRDRLDILLLALIYVAVLIGVTLTNLLPTFGVGPASVRIAPLLTAPCLAAFPILVRRRMATLGDLRRERETLLAYLPLPAVDRLLANLDSVAPQADAAVVFTDLRNFTRVSERVAPADLLRWLDGFFTHLSEEVLAQGGMVDKLIGDGVLAVFGVPTPIERPADAALAAAQGMQRALAHLNRSAPIHPGIELRMGVGIHYGPVAAASLGRRARRTYTVLGDVVNTAKRVESLTKTVGYPILLSRAAHERLRPDGRAAAVFLGAFAVAGKHEPIELFGYPDAGGHLWTMRETPDTS